MTVTNPDPRELYIELCLLYLARYAVAEEILDRWSYAIYNRKVIERVDRTNISDVAICRKDDRPLGALESLFFPTVGRLDIYNDRLDFTLDDKGLRSQLIKGCHRALGAIEVDKTYHMYSRGLKGNISNVCHFLGIDGFLYTTRKYDNCGASEASKLLTQKNKGNLFSLHEINFYGITAIESVIELLAPMSLPSHSYIYEG